MGIPISGKEVAIAFRLVTAVFFDDAFHRGYCFNGE